MDDFVAAQLMKFNGKYQANQQKPEAELQQPAAPDTPKQAAKSYPAPSQERPRGAPSNIIRLCCDPKTPSASSESAEDSSISSSEDEPTPMPHTTPGRFDNIAASWMQQRGAPAAPAAPPQPAGRFWR